MLILLNAISIQDSGGITVLDKMLQECIDSNYNYLIICNENKNILELVRKYQEIKNFEFLVIKNKGFLHRLYYENIVFNQMIKEKNIDLIYNFSGSAQYFLNIPQVTKIQNLLFYCKNIDQLYLEQKAYFKWFKQIVFKRVVFHSMTRQTKYLEVQSSHVKEYMGDFIDVSTKRFFIKSDIEIDQDTLVPPKEYDFSKTIRFLYIVGPHFEYLHKNFRDFVNTMVQLQNDNFDFEIVITLTKEQLHDSNLWDKNLDKKTHFLGYVSHEDVRQQFCDNTILISTSVIETLGLHVIEAIQNGVLAIAPNEKYALDVYGQDITTYSLFDAVSLKQTILSLGSRVIQDIILSNQKYLIINEKSKEQNVTEIFEKILKGNNV